MGRFRNSVGCLPNPNVRAPQRHCRAAKRQTVKTPTTPCLHLVPMTDIQMIKSELVQCLVLQNPHLYQRDIEKLVGAILGEIVVALARGNRVSCAVSARFL
jgi:hypothetical protein